MKNKKIAPLVVVGLLSAWAPAAHVDAQSQAQPKLEIPKPGVSQVMTMEGRFVRAAYNNEGYAILGYQPANRSIGEEWLLLDVGVALQRVGLDPVAHREADLEEQPLLADGPVGGLIAQDDVAFVVVRGPDELALHRHDLRHPGVGDFHLGLVLRRCVA